MTELLKRLGDLERLAADHDDISNARVRSYIEVHEVQSVALLERTYVVRVSEHAKRIDVIATMNTVLQPFPGMDSECAANDEGDITRLGGPCKNPGCDCRVSRGTFPFERP